MDIRTTENCQKYREAKQFVKEYENEYNSILHKKYDIDMLLWDKRLRIMYCRNSLKDNPNFNHLKAHITNHKKTIKKLLKEKYKQFKKYKYDI